MRTQGPDAGMEMPPAGEARAGPGALNRTDDIEAGNAPQEPVESRPKLFSTVDPSKLLDPIRTDPIKALELRKRRLDRQADSSMPEIHYIGQVLSGKNITTDHTEGAFCRWRLEHGKAWQHLGGDLQVCRM
jgi:hypothetical protein